MCLICAEFEKERLTIAEARRALGEMASTLEPEHVEEVTARLRQAEAEQAEG